MPLELSAAAPSPTDLMGQGHSALASNDPEMAITAFTWVLWLEPNNAEAYLYRGEAHYQLGSYQLALADANRAFELNPWDPFVYALRSMVYQALGQPNKARIDFEQATK